MRQQQTSPAGARRRRRVRGGDRHREGAGREEGARLRVEAFVVVADEEHGRRDAVSWQEIRAATKNGRTYRYRVEVPGKPTKERVLTFTKVDDNGAEIFAGGDAPKRMGWVALQKDAEFPKDKLTVREESVKLPGGKFDCVVYELKGDAGETWTYFFAKSLPGAPILFYTEQDGRRLKTTTLLQHIPGKDS